MPIKIFAIVIFVWSVLRSDCRSFFLIDEYQKTAYYQCFKQSGSSSIALFVTQTSQSLNQDAVQNFYNALSSGLAVQTILQPYRCRQIPQYLQFLNKNLKLNLINKIWIFPGLPVDQCEWRSFSPEDNCRFMVQLMDGLGKMGIRAGVFGISQYWEYVFGDMLACQDLGHLPLWWVPNQTEQDEQPSFNSYKQFGGWKVPYMKLYKQTPICGRNIYENYYP